MDVREYGTMLGVWAHPDDETYLSAGLMAAAADAGSRVVCVTATRGEEGSQDLDRWPREKMGQVREIELLRCLEVLGVREHQWLDYHDGRCAGVPFEEAVAKILAVFEDVQPDSVFTFGPDGMTGHDDHKAISAWTTRAFERAAKPGARLFYATTTPEWAERYVPTFQRFNVFGPGTPPQTPRAELAVHYELPDDVMDRKLRGILEHESQVQGMRDAFGEEFMKESNAVEFFRLAATR
ncbi:MAG TPA: PIG-L family deacetylase [Actinomycetota bacterium]|nr:PIG-L family deacetylase [Actinomycetota bacterium]